MIKIVGINCKICSKIVKIVWGIYFNWVLLISGRITLSISSTTTRTTLDEN